MVYTEQHSHYIILANVIFSFNLLKGCDNSTCDHASHPDLSEYCQNVAEIHFSCQQAIYWKNSFGSDVYVNVLHLQDEHNTVSNIVHVPDRSYVNDSFFILILLISRIVEY